MGVILFSWQLSAQLNPEKIKLGVMAGYAFYQQDDLKSVNREILSQLPFESQIIDNFDPVFFFGCYAQYELFSHFYIGPAYEYRYTGSRLGTKDYSGSANRTRRLRGTSSVAWHRTPSPIFRHLLFLIASKV